MPWEAAGSLHVVVSGAVGGVGSLAGLIDDRELEVPIANSYPLAHGRDAYRELERRRTHGKIGLVPEYAPSARRPPMPRRNPLPPRSST